jgi:hypothetical protein
MGLNRSQQVRIGGQKVTYGKVTYVDLGGLSSVVAAPTATETEESESTPGLEKETAYYYVITATDAFGGETPPSSELKSGAALKGSNATGKHHNVNTLEWTAVPNATGYNVYRGTEAGKEKLLASVTTNKYEDAGAATKEGTPPSTNNTYVAGKAAVSAKKELKEHTTYGALIPVGPITASNLDWVPLNEAAAWELSLESEKVKVKEAKELRQRSTGIFRASGPATASISSIKSTASNEKYVAVVYNTITNVVEGIVGEDEKEKEASITKVLEKVTGNQQLLYLLNTKGTTKTVTNATTQVPTNPPVIARV